MEECRVPVDEFNAALWKRFHNGKIRNVYPLSKYNDIIEKIKTMEENPPCNTPGEYYLLRKFIVVNINGKERLSCKPENCVLTKSIRDLCKDRSLSTKFYVALEEIYTFLDEAHKWVKHGCRDRVIRKIQSQGIVNITRDTVELFLSFCRLCRPQRSQTSRKTYSKTVVTHSERVTDSPPNGVLSENSQDNSPILSNSTLTDAIKIEINPNRPAPTVCTFTRGFVDLIDYTFTPDGDYRYFFLYLDVQTCFCVLYPVRCKCTFEVVSHLLNVFTLLGPPQVLHSNFETDFISTIVCHMKQALPELVLVSGSTNYSEVQEVAQNCIFDVNSMLKSWMFENNTNNWSYGLKLIQLRKNTKLPSNSTKSPFECFFGRSINLNLLPNIDASLLRGAEKEEQLLNLISEQNISEQLPYEQLQVSLDPDICTLVQNHVRGNATISESKNERTGSPQVKQEPISDSEIEEINGFELSDSSNDICCSPDAGNLEIIIKEEKEDS